MGSAEALQEGKNTIPPDENKLFKTHIYQRVDVAKHYEDNFNRCFALPDFENFINRTLSIYFGEEEYPLEIFEGGIGTGILAIPVLQYMMNRDFKSSKFVGLDNSKAMLYILRQKENFIRLASKGQDRVTVEFGDLEKPLKYSSSSFNTIVLGGVLHCIYEIGDFFVRMDRILKNCGYMFIILKPDSSIKLQCDPTADSSDHPPEYMNFWRYYHFLRTQKRYPVDPRCKFIHDMDFVKKFIEIQFNGRYVFQNQHPLNWSAETCYDSIIFSIEHGLSFAVGQGVPESVRNGLAKKMKRWVVLNGLQNNKIKIEHQMEVLVWKKR